MSAPRLLTVEQVAELLQLDRFTIYRWCATRKIPVVRLSTRALRIRADDVERLIQTMTTPADPRTAIAPFNNGGEP